MIRQLRRALIVRMVNGRRGSTAQQEQRALDLAAAGRETDTSVEYGGDPDGWLLQMPESLVGR